MDRKLDLTGNPGGEVKKIVHTNVPKENETMATKKIEPKADQTMRIEETKENQITGTMEIENLQTPRKKKHTIENIPQIDTNVLKNLLISCYGKMEKYNIINQLKKSIPLFGESMNMIDTKVHMKIFAEIIKEMGKFKIEQNFKPKLGGNVSLNIVLLTLTSTMLGYVTYLKNGIENYQKLEKDKKVLFLKVIYGFNDFIVGISKLKLQEILDLMTKLELKDNSPLFAKMSHNLLRMFVNLAIRDGPKGETMTKLFRDDGDYLDLIMAEKNPEQFFTHIKFSSDFIALLKEISCTNVCLQFYNKVNAINKNEEITQEKTKVEIIQIIDFIINKKCYFARNLPTRGETLYNDDILLNAKMSNYSLKDASKLDLIFTLLHEMSHVKRINCSFDSDYFSNTPKEFITQFKEFNDMNEEEKQNFWEVPEIGVPLYT